MSNVESILESIEKLTLLEAAELVKKVSKKKMLKLSKNN